MMMSMVSGFLVGAVTAASLTVLYGDRLSSSLREAVDQQSPDSPIVAHFTPALQAIPAAGLSAALGQKQPEPAVEKISLAQVEAPEPGPGLEQRWAEFASRADKLQPAGEFPWRACFQRAAASYELPEPLLLAIASGESNFDPAARSDKEAIGLMQIRWPHTSRHLGVLREADLYDPCTNVDAGARYLAELADRFDNNLHLTVAAYNYGPGRIEPGQVPEGANWYSHYIYQHLQQVLGEEHVATSKLIPGTSADAHGEQTVGPLTAGRQVLMSFNVSHRARDFIEFLQGEVPELNLQQQSEALGQHDVVLLYHSESERLSALDSISAAGISPLVPRSTSKRYL